MKRLPNNALQKALVPFLRERTGYRVYDYVPENATLPFITLGAVTVQDKSTKTEDMTKASVHIHIYSNYKGRFEINTLAETLINVFASEQIDLSAEEFFVCSQGVDFYETYPEDEIGYSGVITLEALIQNKKEE
ncbi:MAG: DUF3168 domain-containing protein [Succiniclasticum sp.]|uniref:DUF3168 domain-containing protein n=1 Tax=Succiniclasticum sp. TaxID=2775030 RepID=UPI002A91A4FD|nr:DUF3168 domain-containing protein [Succiniclasticum sp.]MDY6289854.1 DUF3168 domain-containing protein [Succiniclasticum sp.]